MAKAIMIQGTTSNAGKSLLAAGLCRVFARAGYRVAPFKSQNMALNSFVTVDGLEMGRAQVTQAECAGIEPDVRMNPVLLKPTSDSGSQVILNGEVLGNMKARDYYAYKHKLVAPIMEAYESLAAENDIIVLEGAGSPAEINLKQGDIVNMGMARMAKVPVLLAGDIDRGGVFASLAGTNLLLEGWERDLLKGVIINKFRGDMEILRPGLHMLEDLIHKPVLGVVPYLHIDIDDEDSLSPRLEERGEKSLLEIGVIRLPRMSNFTDFSVFCSVEGVSVRYITSLSAFGRPDMVILPGTKSTLSDLLWMRGNGLEAELKKYASAGNPVFGICGGFQMLGQTVRDPQGVEGGGELAGIGLLPGETVFQAEKSRRQVTGRFGQVDGLFSGLSGKSFSGYEIHMGETPGGESLPLLEVDASKGPQPGGLQKGNVYGCYIHGLFDREEVVGEIICVLARRKGIPADSLRAVDRAAYKQCQYDFLANSLEKDLDLEKIYDILNTGV